MILNNMDALIWGAAVISIAVIWKFSIKNTTKQKITLHEEGGETKEEQKQEQGEKQEQEHHVYWHPVTNGPLETKVPVLFSRAHLREVQDDAEAHYKHLKIDISLQDNHITGACLVIRPRFRLTQLLSRYSSYFYALYARFSKNMSSIQMENRIRADLSQLIAQAPPHERDDMKDTILHVIRFLVSGSINNNNNNSSSSMKLKALQFFGVPELIAQVTNQTACLVDDWVIREHESEAYERMFPGRQHPVFSDTYTHPFANSRTKTRELPLMKRCYGKADEGKDDEKQELPWFWELDSSTIKEEKTQYRQDHYLWLTNSGDRNVLPSRSSSSSPSASPAELAWVPDYQKEEEEGHKNDNNKDEKHLAPRRSTTTTTILTETETETATKRTGAIRMNSLRRLMKPLTDALQGLNPIVQKSVWISGPSVAEILSAQMEQSTVAIQEPVLDVWVIAESAQLDPFVHKICRALKPTPPETVLLTGSLRSLVFLHQYVLVLPDYNLTLRFHTVPVNELGGSAEIDERAAFYLLANQPIDGYAILWKPHTQTLWWLARTEDSTLTRSQCMYPCLYSNPLVFRLLYDGWALLLPTWLYSPDDTTETTDLAVRMQFPYISSLLTPTDPNSILTMMNVQTWSPLSMERQAMHFYRKYTQWFIQTHHYRSPAPRKQITRNELSAR